MKNRYLFAAIAVLLTFTTVSAQRNSKQANRSNRDIKQQECRINNLTEEQQDYLKQERVKFQKEIQADRNQLGELMAKKRTLETTEPLNQKNLDKVLSDINAVKTSMAKKRVRHQQAIKSQLTDEQLIAFEQHSNNNRKRMHKGQGADSKGKFECMSKGSKQNMHGKKGGNRMKGHGYANGRHCGRGHGKGNYNECILSDELKEELKTARLELLKQEQPLSNQLNELRAQYRTITYGRTIDLKKVDKNIDQQAAIQLELAKLKSKHKLDIRSQLSDEEKIWFDKRQMQRMRYNAMN
ncbi:hypothetical protein [Carboxylicivirga sp. RSCT41]|uniref:hypothetical protein n=1 Tax=Carboxylicivirga agarovorans TaxID=3417570 RepID=UPI003D32CBE2